MSVSPMRIVTRREMIRSVADRWLRSYRHAIENPANDYPWPNGETKKSIHEELKKLDPETATAAQIDAIIGNGSWTALHCNECGTTDNEQILQLGEVDYDMPHYGLCAKCLHSAFALWETRS